jgi:hypothetical protein
MTRRLRRMTRRLRRMTRRPRRMTRRLRRMTRRLRRMTRRLRQMTRRPRRMTRRLRQMTRRPRRMTRRLRRTTRRLRRTSKSPRRGASGLRARHRITAPALKAFGSRPAQRVGRMEPRAEAEGRCPGWRDDNGLRPERPRELSCRIGFSRPFRPQRLGNAFLPRASAFGLSPGLESPDPLGRTQEMAHLLRDEPLGVPLP